ncbi:MAG TPA: hypothetical protein VMH39_17595, partial [Gemmatimonadaceae bacterium]|nr:hypothetical protein [Gemmatimonadaceae bacterium]
LSTFAGARTISHSGAYGGYRTTFMRFPDNHLSVITLCNVADASPTLAEQVASIFIFPSVTHSASDATAPLDMVADSGRFGLVQLLTDPPTFDLGAILDATGTDDQALIAGRYFSPELNMAVTIRSRGGVLVMERPRGDDVRFSRSGPDVYTSPDDITLRMRRTESGRVSGFSLTVGRVRDLSFARQDE